MMNYLQHFNTVSVIIRLALAMLFGGIIGLERERKRRAAGFRTYMLVCLGASLTMILGQYLSHMLDTCWNNTGLTMDASRIGAQVVNGVGFLGAGTVLVTGKQQAKGLTTAAGLWASACTGLAIGAGFYECVLFSFLLITVVVRVFPTVEAHIIEHSKYMNFYLEFDSMEDVGYIISKIKSSGVQIYEVEINRGTEDCKSGAVFVVRLNERQSHTRLLLALSKIDCIRLIEEI